MDKAFEAGWNSALGALVKVLKLGLFRDEILFTESEIKDHLASLKCGAGNEPSPELVNALRAYMSQSGSVAQSTPEQSAGFARRDEDWLAKLRDEHNRFFNPGGPLPLPVSAKDEKIVDDLVKSRRFMSRRE